MALGAVGIVFVILGFVGPWWTINTQTSAVGQTITGVAEFRLFGGTATVQGPGFSQTNTTDYSDSPNTRGVFLTAAALSGSAIVMGALMAVANVMPMEASGKRRLGLALGILAFLLALAAPLYAMAQLPVAVNADSQGGPGSTDLSGFWGTKSVSVFGVTIAFAWGAAWAWYVVLVAAILFLVGGILSSGARVPFPTPPVPPPLGPPETPGP